MQPAAASLSRTCDARIIAAMRALLPVVLCSTLLLAQERAPQPTNRPLMVDGVIATVNDSAILLSSVRTQAASRLRELTARFGQLTSQQIEFETQRALDTEVERHSLAHAAKSIGKFTPEQIDQIVQSELERDQQEQIRDVGSINAYSRELKRLGRDWPTYENEQRIDKLYELAEELGVRQRLARQTNLYVTPRMLRETYTANRGMFVHAAEATVVQVRCTGPSARETATEASTVWRLQPMTPRQLADKFADQGAIALGEVSAAELAEAMASIRAFALAGPTGAVSPPFQIGDAWHVARVAAFRPARNATFEDSGTQDELRSLCQRKVIEEFRAQYLERAKQRTEVWRMFDSPRR
jgi:hypothetical protein